MQQSSHHPEIVSKINNSFAKQNMMSLLNAKIIIENPGKVVIQAPILAETHQQHGFAHAAVTFALGDSAAGYAALSVMPLDREVLTAEMKINLLAPAAGQELRAIGHVIKPGRRLVIVGATVLAIDGGKETEVAVMQGTMVPV